jgi:hypothetical protein
MQLCINLSKIVLAIFASQKYLSQFCTTLLEDTTKARRSLSRWWMMACNTSQASTVIRLARNNASRISKYGLTPVELGCATPNAYRGDSYKTIP